MSNLIISCNEINYEDFLCHRENCKKCMKTWSKVSSLTPKYSRALTEKKLIKLISKQIKILNNIMLLKCGMMGIPRNLQQDLNWIDGQVHSYEICFSNKKEFEKISFALRSILQHPTKEKKGYKQHY